MKNTIIEILKKIGQFIVLVAGIIYMVIAEIASYLWENHKTLIIQVVVAGVSILAIVSFLAYEFNKIVNML